MLTCINTLVFLERGEPWSSPYVLFMQILNGYNVFVFSIVNIYSLRYTSVAYL